MMQKKDEPKAQEKDKKAPDVKPVTLAGRKIEPISADMKSEPKPDKEPKKEKAEEPEKVDEQPKEEPEAPAPAAPAEPEATEEPSSAPTDEPKDDSESPDDKAKAKTAEAEAKAQEAEAERQAKLQELVESKKYYVKIEDTKTASVRTFFLTVLVILLVGAIGLVLLVDAGIVDVGIGLPFDLIK